MKRRASHPLPMPIDLPSGTLTDAQWDRIQQAVLARGDVDEYPNITLYPDLGEPEDVEAELRRLSEWLVDEGLLEPGWLA